MFENSLTDVFKSKDSPVSPPPERKPRMSLVQVFFPDRNTTDEVSFAIQKVSDSNGLWLPVFTNQGELAKGEQTSVCPQLMRYILSMTLEDNDCVGVVLNPFSNSLSLSRGICADILDFFKKPRNIL